MNKQIKTIGIVFAAMLMLSGIASADVDVSAYRELVSSGVQSASAIANDGHRIARTTVDISMTTGDNGNGETYVSAGADKYYGDAWNAYSESCIVGNSYQNLIGVNTFVASSDGKAVGLRNGLKVKAKTNAEVTTVASVGGDSLWAGTFVFADIYTEAVRTSPKVAYGSFYVDGTAMAGTDDRTVNAYSYASTSGSDANDHKVVLDGSIDISASVTVNGEIATATVDASVEGKAKVN